MASAFGSFGSLRYPTARWRCVRASGASTTNACWVRTITGFDNHTSCNRTVHDSSILMFQSFTQQISN
eukprot:4561064-Pleurochrysis_carterae.AAC.1